MRPRMSSGRTIGWCLVAYRISRTQVIPSAAYWSVRIVVWVLLVSGLPLLRLPGAEALWWAGVIDTSSASTVLSIGRALGEALFGAVAAPICVCLLLVLGTVLTHGGARFRDQLRFALRSRTGWFGVAWFVSIVVLTIAGRSGGSLLWRTPILIVVPLVATVLAVLLIVRTRRGRFAVTTLYADVREADWAARAREMRTDELHAGRDFPHSYAGISTAIEARHYADVAQDRATVLRYVGAVLALIASAVTGSIVIWAFAGDPGPRALVAVLPLLAYLAGFALQRRGNALDRLHDRLEEHAEELDRPQRIVRRSLRRLQRAFRQARSSGVFPSR